MPVRVEPGSEVIPGYRLIERLGGGGFGEVWKAEAPGGLVKAIKIVYGDLQTTDPDGTKRAEQELKALRRVQSVRHPYLLSLERYDIIENRLLIVMELADRNLWDRFKECQKQGLPGIPRDELLRYMEEAAEVLDLMNKQYGLQHLDIKPQNLFLIHNHAKVADFGLVKDLEGMMATVTGGITPVYAAPETFDGKVSRFCDQYSLAIVYQELLTGQRPFSGISMQQLIMQHLSGQPNLTPLPRSDRAAIARALSKKPEARFPTCSDLIAALRKATIPESPSPTAPTIMSAEPSAPAAEPAVSPAEPAVADPVAPPLDREMTASEESPAASSALLEEPETWESEVVPLRSAPPRQTGEGVLFPALVIGLGQKGLEVLQVLHSLAHHRFGPLPHLRLLHIDTDVDTQSASSKSHLAANLSPSETFLARLNRPAHYMRAGGRSPHETWINVKYIHRIQRIPATMGLRCLGRLAFVDHYKALAARLRSDLEACIRPDALRAAVQQTQLGLRCNYPRVYIVTSLTGATGGGMFLDLAYVVRTQLRLLGYAEPEVVGVLLLPNAEVSRGNPLALGNAYAALRELLHFSSPLTTFQFRFDDHEGRILDKEAPFCRAILLPLEAEHDREHLGECTRLAGDFLFCDLFSSLGRTADECRPSLESPEGPVRVRFHTLGMYRFSWPRRALMQRIARKICEQIVQRWVAKNAPGNVREALKQWLLKELTRLEMDAEHLFGHLQEACEKRLGQSPESYFHDLVEPLVPRSRRDPDPEPAEVLEVIRRMEDLVGTSRPEAPGSKRNEPLLLPLLDEVSEALARKWSSKLTQLVLRLVEDPSYRIRGAEESIRQLTQFLEDILQTYEPILRELEDTVAEAWEQIEKALAILEANPGGGRRTAAVVAELVEALRQYPRARYQSLLVRRLINVYVTLRGTLSDQTRELAFCRQRLADLIKSLEQVSTDSTSSTLSTEKFLGTYLLPAGCRTIGEAVQLLLQEVTAEDVHQLDKQIQAMISQNFTSLAQTCLTSGNALNNLQEAMQNLVEGFVASRLVDTSVVDLFMTAYADYEKASLEAIVSAYEKAGPTLASKVSCTEPEIRIVAVPPGESAAAFRERVRKALPHLQVLFTDSLGDIVIYREQPDLPGNLLELLGKPARDAYEQLADSDGFNPHAREDIPEWIE